MSQRFLKLLDSHGGVLLIAIIAVLMIGPTGVMRVVDRILPPPQVAVVEGVSSGVDRLRRANDRKIDKVIENQVILIDAVDDLTRELNESSLMLLRMDRRTSQLEAWRKSLGTPMLTEERLPWRNLGETAQ